MKNCNLLFKLLIMLNTLRSYYHIVRCVKKSASRLKGYFYFAKGAARCILTQNEATCEQIAR